jgi:hypothetical protein
MVAVLLLLSGSVLFSLVYLLDTPANSPPPSSTIQPVDDDVQRCKPGPWGEMVYRSILIEPLAESMPRDATLNTHTRWFFKAASLQDVSAVLDKAGVSEPLKPALMGSLIAADGGFVATPGNALRGTGPVVAKSISSQAVPHCSETG